MDQALNIGFMGAGNFQFEDSESKMKRLREQIAELKQKGLLNG